MSVFELSDELIFPHPSLAEEDGLLAIGGDLSPQRLIFAYKNGIFPWFNEDEPILWWSPDPRCVLFPNKLKISHSLKQTINRNIFSVRFDTNFESVINHCAEVKRKNQEGTWITSQIKEAYIRLHQLGYAHSVESYFENQLVGGLYGVTIGKAFFGESMFYLMPNASKVAFVTLVEHLQKWHFDIIDNQQTTNHLLSFGAEEISRKAFLDILSTAVVKEGKIGKWNS
jgi:leucyl/phenylalanyl-tRNA--protein transferase